MLKDHKIYLAVFLGIILFVILIGSILFFKDDDLLAKNDYREDFKKSVFKQIDQGDAPLSYKQEIKQSIDNFFHGIEKAENNLSTSSASQISQSSTASVFQSATTTKLKSYEGIKEVTISERPANEILPSYYLNYTNYLVEKFKEENLIPKEEKITFLKTGDVFNFLENSFDYFVELGAIPKDNYSNLRYGLTYIWPRTLEMEFGSPAYNNNYSDDNFSDANIVKIISFLFKKIQVKNVFAQDCYRSGAPMPGGANLWAPCCDCYCGHSPCGCLNAVCSYGNAAIWDPMTGICGCG